MTKQLKIGFQWQYYDSGPKRQLIRGLVLAFKLPNANTVYIGKGIKKKKKTLHGHADVLVVFAFSQVASSKLSLKAF